MKALLLAAAAAFLLPAAAQAAPVNWSGPYLGVNLGYGLGHTAIDDQDCIASCSSQNLDPNGVNLGGVAGYNWQHGAAVLGVEADYNYSDAKKEKVTDWPSLHRANINSFGSVRARAGLAVDNTLLYATVGMSIIQQDVAAVSFDSVGGPPDGGFTRNTTRVGLAAGAGAEMAVSDHWRVKMEYLYLSTPGEDDIQTQFGDTCDGGRHYCTFGYTTNVNVIRIGANYAF